MPRVPVLEGPSVQTRQLSAPMQGQIDASSGLQAASRALGQVAQIADQRVEREIQTEAWGAQAEINNAFVQWNAERRKNAQGANARGYAADVTAWWDKAKEDHFSKLSPMAQQQVARSLSTARLAALESASGYENQQLDIGERSALQATVSSLSNQAIAAGPDKAAPVLAQAATTLREWGAKKGVDVEPEVMKITTGAHLTIINTLMQQDPKKAEAYFATHKKEIDGTRWDEIGARINQVSAITDGETKANEVWAKYVKPGDYKNPVDQFALEKEMRAAFPNDPTRQKAGIQALREMSAAWNKSQTEAIAAGTNQVYKMLDSGTPMSKVMKSDAWASLSGDQQHRIRLQLEQEAAARASRAASEEARQLAALQRADKLAVLTKPDAYLRYSDPGVLAGMSRQQVEALRVDFGLEGTQHLLSRWDTLQKPGKVAEARMDTEDFNHIATQLGMDPYNARGTGRAQLGELKYRVEQMIDMAQKAKGKELTREEKGELMRGEMSRTVTVNPGFFSPNRETPVIQLAPEDARRVVIPAAEKAQIADALRVMYARNPANPLFAQTEENMRRLFLANKSRAATLIPEPKK